MCEYDCPHLPGHSALPLAQRTRCRVQTPQACQGPTGGAPLILQQPENRENRSSIGQTTLFGAAIAIEESAGNILIDFIGQL